MSRIIIKKLIVLGPSYRRTINFNEDFTIISGEKTSGKSLILSLIDYSFGKSTKIDLKVQKELDARCDQVFLEILIDKEVLTLKRALKKKTDIISIYFCSFENIDEYTPKTIKISEAMHFLMTKLKISEYKLIKHKKHSTLKELQVVSFRDIFRYVYTSQHLLGTKDFLEKKTTFKSNKNPHAFKMMFNLVEADRDMLKEELVGTQNKIQNANKVISGLNLYLQDKDATDINILFANSDKYQKEIEKHKQSKKLIIDNSKSNDNSENQLYIKLKNDLQEIANKLFDFQNEKKHIILSINSKKLLLEEYDKEKLEIDATIEINYKLVIPNHNIECPLCHSTVSGHTHSVVHQNTESVETLRKVINEINNKIKLVTVLINKELENIKELNIQIERLSRKQRILNEAISEFAKETNVPFLSQIDSINSLINRLVKDQEIVKEELRIHRKINDTEKEIKDLEYIVISLENKLKSFKISEKEHKEIFDYLDNEYKGFMKRLKYETDGETFIHREQYIPYYEGSSVYAHDSGGLLECMQLSYLGAILKSKTQGYASGHPGLLLLDSLSKYVGTLTHDLSTEENSETQELEKLVEEHNKISEKDKIKDPEVYEEFFKILIELSTSHQIILVENTPPEKFNLLYTNYTFYEGERGLINEEKNEFSTNEEL